MTDEPLLARLVVGSQNFPCNRCNLRCVVAVQLPHSWDVAGKPTTVGWRQAPLCPSCDLEDPHAGPLAMFLRWHEQFGQPGWHADEDILAEFAKLLGDWLPHASIPQLSEEAYEADLAAWRRGEFD
ncbi:DUF6300 family protein [Catellatospora sp. NPDC049133]|uniref:DUF6300 family protein n=1 Tax=Catellatospora sp. NPDC049133 TaxID=3155499 RepID=UPI0033E26BC8